MSILIKSMEMPKTYPLTVIIYPDGQVLSETCGARDIHGEAVPVPPHGDLIDVEELMEKIACLVPYYIETGYEKAFTDGLSSAYEIVKATPTIIPASEEGE